MNKEAEKWTHFSASYFTNASQNFLYLILLPLFYNTVSINNFENLGYRVYFTGAKYNYQGENRIVESNEYLVAIKGL